MPKNKVKSMKFRKIVVDRTIKVTKDAHDEFYSICKATEHRYIYECVREAMELLAEIAKDKTIDIKSLPSFPSGKKYIKLKIDRQSYDEFIDICRNILHQRRSDCLRTALATWAMKYKDKIHEIENPPQNDVQDVENLSQNHEKLTEVISFKIDQTVFNEFKSLCEQNRYYSISKCIRDAISLWMQRPSVVKPSNNQKFISFKMDPEQYKQFELKCINSGYNISECIRQAISLWIEKQQIVGVKNE